MFGSPLNRKPIVCMPTLIGKLAKLFNVRSTRSFDLEKSKFFCLLH